METRSPVFGMPDPSYSSVEDIMGVLRIFKWLDRSVRVIWCLKYEINL